MRVNKTLRFLLSIVLTALLVPAGFAAGVGGTWKLIVDTGEGTREYEMVMTQDGARVVAKLGDDQIKGTFENDALELAGEYYSPEEGYRAPLRLSGKLANGELSGSIHWDTYDVTFRATRKP